VEAEIRVPEGQGIDDVGELASLREWLRGERGLAGAVREVRRPPGPHELGGVVEVLVVALGSSSVAGTLATALFGWLRTRRPSLMITMSRGSRTFTVQAGPVRDGDLRALVEKVLEADDEH
jgi:hypothetical protein